MNVCDCNIIHPEKVEKAKTQMLNDETYHHLSEFYKAMSDYNRLRILSVLFHGELCVCDIANIMGMTQSAVSHQLKTLKQARLVKYRKDGKVVFYALDDMHVQQVFKMGVEHISHVK